VKISQDVILVKEIIMWMIVVKNQYVESVLDPQASQEVGSKILHSQLSLLVTQTVLNVPQIAMYATLPRH